MGTGIRFRHSCDRQGEPRTRHGKTRRVRTPARPRQALCSPRALATTRKKRSRRDTGKGVGRRRQAAWGPRLEEGCGREPPGVPTVPAHPGQGAAGTPKLEKPRGRRAASVPGQRARKKVALQQKTPTRLQAETNRKTAHVLLGGFSGVEREATFHIPFQFLGTRRTFQAATRKSCWWGQRGTSPPALPRHPGGALTPARAGQCWWGAKLPPQPGPVGSWADGHY